MKNENQDLLDLCRLNLMEDTVKDSPAPDRDIAMKAIDRKKRELVIKIESAVYEPDAMEKHLETNTVDGTYPWTEAERFQIEDELQGGKMS